LSAAKVTGTENGCDAFEWTIADIWPDLETKIAILKKKAEPKGAIQTMWRFT
jgi:hypothetical protein